MEFTGWERLIIVLSVLFGVPSAMIAYDINDNSSATVYYTVKGMGSGEFWRKALSEPELKNCKWKTARAQYWSYNRSTSISCDNYPPLGQSIKWFLIPGGIMWLLASIIGWVVSGFRKSKPST